jgi:hypothetical protein
MRSQRIKAHRQVVAMPFDGAKRQVGQRPLGKGLFDLVWAQAFDLVAHL